MIQNVLESYFDLQYNLTCIFAILAFVNNTCYVSHKKSNIIKFCILHTAGYIPKCIFSQTDKFPNTGEKCAMGRREPEPVLRQHGQQDPVGPDTARLPPVHQMIRPHFCPLFVK